MELPFFPLPVPSASAAEVGVGGFTICIAAPLPCILYVALVDGRTGGWGGW